MKKAKVFAMIAAAALSAAAAVSGAAAEELTSGSMDTIETVQDLLTDDLHVDVSAEPEQTSTEQAASMSEEETLFEPEEPVLSFVREAMGDELDGEITDQLFFERDSEEDPIRAIRIETYSTENGVTLLEQIVTWHAADGTWTIRYDENGAESALLPDNNHLMAEWIWNLSRTDQGTVGAGGYDLHYEDGILHWSYGLTAEDVQNGVHLTELDGVIEELPAQFYVGLRMPVEGRDGLQQIHGVTYHLREDGIVTVNTDLILDDKIYHFDENGHCLGMDTEPLKGWQTLGGSTYFYQEDGIRAVGWMELDGEKYYFDEDGVLQTGRTQIGNHTYYFAPDTGAMHKGFLEQDNAVYYFDSTSGQMRTGFVSISGRRYYFSLTSGKMHRGWLTVDGKKFYCSSKGFLFTGMHNVGRERYLFRSSGQLVTNEKILVHKKTEYYICDRQGRLTQISKERGLARLRLKNLNWDVKKVYHWCAKLRLSRVPSLASGELPEYEKYALYGFENSKGDQYVMASCLYMMMKEMGYDVHYVKGKVQTAEGKSLDSAWCEADFGSKTYVYDPYCQKKTGKFAFRFVYGKSGIWKHFDDSRII